MIVNNVDQINFRAKLNISGCETHKSYWEDVAKAFFEDTSNKKGEILIVVSELSKEPKFYIKNFDTYITCDEKVLNNLVNQHPTIMVSKLVSLFDIMSATICKNKVAIKKIDKQFGNITCTNMVYYHEALVMQKEKIHKYLKNIINKNTELRGIRVNI